MKFLHGQKLIFPTSVAKPSKKKLRLFLSEISPKSIDRSPKVAKKSDSERSFVGLLNRHASESVIGLQSESFWRFSCNFFKPISHLRRTPLGLLLEEPIRCPMKGFIRYTNFTSNPPAYHQIIICIFVN